LFKKQNKNAFTPENNFHAIVLSSFFDKAIDREINHNRSSQYVRGITKDLALDKREIVAGYDVNSPVSSILNSR
jgi:hypothetical protein